MPTKKILMLLDNEFTGDMRVENEVYSLTKNGLSVTVLCLNYGDKENREKIFGADIIRIPVSLNWKNKIKGFMNTPLGLWESFWHKHIRKLLKINEFDFIHAHDLYMVPIALKAKKVSSNTPKVVADLHENFSEAVKFYKHFTTFPGNFIKLFQRWGKHEKIWLKKSDFIITVIEEAVERYEKLGIPSSKIGVVQNYVNIDEFDKYPIDNSIINDFKNEFTITYIGGLDQHRGINFLIDGFKLAQNKINADLKLLIVGNGIILNELKAQVENLGIGKNVSFEGWQPPSKLASYIIASNICTIPHNKTNHTDNTIPHKLFQYMYYNKPIISTNCRPLERIIKSSEVGLIYRSEDAVDLAEKIVSLYEDETLRRKFEQNGRPAVKEKYNWDEAVKPLIQFYKS